MDSARRDAYLGSSLEAWREASLGRDGPIQRLSATRTPKRGGMPSMGQLIGIVQFRDAEWCAQCSVSLPAENSCAKRIVISPTANLSDFETI